jgi:hypothetical protein
VCRSWEKRFVGRNVYPGSGVLSPNMVGRREKRTNAASKMTGRNAMSGEEGPRSSPAACLN